MTDKIQIQNQINRVEALIRQYEDSELFTEAERKERIAKQKIELEKLYILKAKHIEVHESDI